MRDVIRVRRFGKAYDSQVAVHDLSFDVAGGDVVGLVGPNGAGKTTTLRVLAGVIPPTQGRLAIAGHNILVTPTRAKAKLAFVPDDPHLFDGLTAWEHLEFSAKVYGVPDWAARAADLLGRFGMDAMRDALSDELSRGMRQKVAICSALLHEPSALLLDEPMTGLDPHAVRTLTEILREQADRGAAIMISSHLLGQIEPVCDRFLILAEGRLLFQGTKQEIRAQLPSLREDATLEEIFFQATHRPPPRRVRGSDRDPTDAMVS